ncbi:DUF2141 domain-containing protein [Urechidicola vernalis]|uniref:DUF2141 domain-containing protein n=1 Tax=Urechidicola vernalis TaxID=3075600 RepID=A0ABU2Y210_9FLAO|nr:DUF2141 domain-containing protein [Urechidicola sp. P050]MDT0552200.1 DUF2141 domain-containing protein [Urechidicola sp. P050]
MIRVVLTIVMSMSALFGFSQDSNSTKSFNNVEVAINDISTDKGTIYYMIFDSEESFNKRNALKSSYSKITNGKTTTSFSGLPNGNYAVLCFHDVNDNQQMDLLESVIPKEQYGVSNNVFNFGPPSFDEAKFEVNNTNLTFEIELIQVL